MPIKNYKKGYVSCDTDTNPFPKASLSHLKSIPQFIPMLPSFLEPLRSFPIFLLVNR